MRQYLDAKQQHRDAILLFRMGDFFEMFYEDALVAARALDLTLTSRSKDSNGGGIPMCGVPFHAVDGYIARLVKRGFRVAICDQVEDPRKAKGLVKREVVRVVSPGTLTDAAYLDAREPALWPCRQWVARPFQGRDRGAESPALLFGVALLDLSTGEFTAAEYGGADAAQLLGDEIAVLKPRELVVPAGVALPATVSGAGVTVTTIDGWTFDADSAGRMLLQQLKAGGLEGFGLDGHPAAVSAAGALIHHLRNTQKVDLAHVTRIAFRQRADALLIDPTTLEHLEVLEGSEGGREGSLLAELDRTMTSIGSRQLRSWLLRPLVAIEPIRDRLDAVEELAFRATDRGKFRETVKPVQDLERLLARAALGTAGPRDPWGSSVARCASPRQDRAGRLPVAASIAARPARRPRRRPREIERTLVDDPPAPPATEASPATARPRHRRAAASADRQTGHR
jgi:DNA mismatch repair protein MutS